MNINISSRNLKKLPKGISNIIEGSFSCSSNQLITLEGGPKKVGGSFNCSQNQLITLKGGPKEVSGSFDCSYNQLTTLKGGPKEVGGSFYCSYNPNLPLSEIIKFIFRCDIRKSIISDYDDELLNKINKNKDNKYKIIKIIFENRS